MCVSNHVCSDAFTCIHIHTYALGKQADHEFTDACTHTYAYSRTDECVISDNCITFIEIHAFTINPIFAKKHV